jgi:hypothetical protein
MVILNTTSSGLWKLTKCAYLLLDNIHALMIHVTVNASVNAKLACGGSAAICGWYHDTMKLREVCRPNVTLKDQCQYF